MMVLRCRYQWVGRQAAVTVGCLVSCSVQEEKNLGQLKSRFSLMLPNIQDEAIVLVHLLSGIQSTESLLAQRGKTSPFGLALLE